MNAFAARLLFVAILITTAPAAAQSPAPASIVVSTNPIDSGAEVYYADDMGFFAKAGLNVQIQPGANGAAIAAAVAGNAVDIGYADVGTLAKRIRAASISPSSRRRRCGIRAPRSTC